MVSVYTKDADAIAEDGATGTAAATAVKAPVAPTPTDPALDFEEMEECFGLFDAVVRCQSIHHLAVPPHALIDD